MKFGRIKLNIFNLFSYIRMDYEVMMPLCSYPVPHFVISETSEELYSFTDVHNYRYIPLMLNQARTTY
jgi:hypothetical protein